MSQSVVFLYNYIDFFHLRYYLLLDNELNMKTFFKGDFECDKPGKKLIYEKLQKDAEKKGNKLVIDSHPNNPAEGIDTHFTAYTGNWDEIARYAMEHKERPNTGHTACPDWWIEEDKEKKLLEDAKKGYIPLYCYLWGDGYYAIWDVRTWDKHYTGKKWKDRYTVVDNGERVCVDTYCVTLSTAIKQGYLN